MQVPGCTRPALPRLCTAAAVDTQVSSSRDRPLTESYLPVQSVLRQHSPHSRPCCSLNGRSLTAFALTGSLHSLTCVARGPDSVVVPDLDQLRMCRDKECDLLLVHPVRYRVLPRTSPGGCWHWYSPHFFHAPRVNDANDVVNGH